MISSFQQTSSFFKKRMNLDQSTYLNMALTKKFFSRPTDDELFYETHPDTTYTLYFKSNYYQKLKSEIQQAYDDGKFTKTSSSKEWNDLKQAFDTAERIDVMSTSAFKPYLSLLIENSTPLTRTLVFKSNKVSISQGMFDFSPKKVDKNYNIEVHLSDTKTKIIFLDLSTNKSALIENLDNSSVGQGGMTLNNEKYMILIDWNKTNTLEINHIVVDINEKDAQMTYYNE